MKHPCRNCEAPCSTMREGGLCFACWYFFEYGHHPDLGHRIGSGAAQESLRATDGHD